MNGKATPRLWQASLFPLCFCAMSARHHVRARCSPKVGDLGLSESLGERGRWEEGEASRPSNEPVDDVPFCRTGVGRVLRQQGTLRPPNITAPSLPVSSRGKDEDEGGRRGEFAELTGREGRGTSTTRALRTIHPYYRSTFGENHHLPSSDSSSRCQKEEWTGKRRVKNQMTFNGMPPFFPANLLVQIPQELEGEKHCVSGSYPRDLNMEEDISDDGLPAAGEKKKRLSLEQVRTLERNFELGNKLEPERKVELARALGLQPRQVAIWFQNRRARWKTKQLEKDYEELKRQLDAMKSENEDLQAQNKKLLCQLLTFKGKEALEPINLNKETEGSCSIRSEDSSDVNLEISRAPPMHDSPTDPLHGRIFFPCYRPPSASRPNTSSKSDTARVENNIQEESLCNMFCSTDDQSAFWAWSDQHNYNH